MARDSCGTSGETHEFRESSPTLHTANAARRWAEPLLAAMPLAGKAGDALVVLSELVTNAVQHAPGPLRVELHQTREQLCIAVEDTDPPVSPSPGAGFGLLLVSRLASPYEVTRTATGKAVRVTMPLTARVGAAS